MFKKNANKKSMVGMLLYVFSLGLAGYGYYQLCEAGQQAAQEMTFPYEAMALFIGALMLTIIGSTLILLSKGDQIMDKLPSEEPEPEDERYATGKKEESEAVEVEEIQKEKKPGLLGRMTKMPIWLIVALSVILALSLTSITMLAIFGL